MSQAISAGQAAKIIGCHRTWVYKLAERGDLVPLAVGIEGQLSFSREQVAGYVQRRKDGQTRDGDGGIGPDGGDVHNCPPVEVRG